MRDLINLVESLLEGRTYDINTGYGSVVRMARVYYNPEPSQAETLAKNSILNGLLYLRGILYRGRHLYVGRGGDLTHHDLIQEFLPNKQERDPDITTFSITNYRMHGPKPTITEVTLYTEKPGDHSVESNPMAARLLEGCKAAVNKNDA
jgi:hypothetical protein